MLVVRFLGCILIFYVRIYASLSNVLLLGGMMGARCDQKNASFLLPYMWVLRVIGMTSVG